MDRIVYMLMDAHRVRSPEEMVRLSRIIIFVIISYNHLCFEDETGKEQRADMR